MNPADLSAALESGNRAREEARIADMNKLLQNIPRSPLIEIAEQNLASEFYKRLVAKINEFGSTLDSAHEVGARLVNFGQAFVFHLDDLGYWDPSLIWFSGKTDEGNPIELIQHVSQISIALVVLTRKNPNEPKQPIGFHSDAAAQQSE